MDITERRKRRADRIHNRNETSGEPQTGTIIFRILPHVASATVVSQITTGNKAKSSPCDILNSDRILPWNDTLPLQSHQSPRKTNRTQGPQPPCQWRTTQPRPGSHWQSLAPRPGSNWLSLSPPHLQLSAASVHILLAEGPARCDSLLAQNRAELRWLCFAATVDRIVAERGSCYARVAPRAKPR